MSTTTRVTLSSPTWAIEARLDEQGYAPTPALIAAMRRAHRTGCLLWTPERITSTQSGNEFDLRPEPRD